MDNARPSTSRAIDFPSGDSPRTRPFDDQDNESQGVISTLDSNQGESYDASGLKWSLHGTVYQLKHLMLILHRAWKMGYSFRLATEMDTAEKFDDVVLHYRDDSGDEVHRFVQLKHKQDETKKIRTRDLLDVNDDEFSVLKYFVSWRKIKTHPDFGGSRSKDFILLTNIGLDVEDLEKENINVTAVEESDDFLKVTKRKKQPKRYKLQVHKRSKLYKILKSASDVHRLARELAERVCGSKDINLKIDIIKRYHVALAREVVDTRTKKLSANFIGDNGLHEKAKRFRNIFFMNTMRLFSDEEASAEEIWEDLKKTSLKLSNTFGKTPESTDSTELPEDYITDAEISHFLNEFILAVNQPNEQELGEMIKCEIGADSQFNLLDASFIRDSFQNAILDWFKEKQGKFLKHKDAEDFFNEMEVKLCSLVTVALSMEYSETLRELEIEFNSENIELQNFIHCRSEDTTNQILELLAPRQTLLISLRVHQTLAESQKCKNNESFVFIRLKTLLIPRMLKQVLRAFEWPHNHNLLVVDCESINPNQYLQTLWHPMCEIMAKNVQKKIIVIAQTAIIGLATQFRIDYKSCHVEDDDHRFRNLTNSSRRKILDKPVTKFQGHRIEMDLGELLGIRDSGNLRADELKGLSEIIDPGTLVELIHKNEIQIGKDLEGMADMRDCYINRTIYRYVVIKEDIFQDQQIPDLLAISGVDRQRLDEMAPMGETFLMARNAVTYSPAISGTNEEVPRKLMRMGENIAVARNLANFTILDDTQEEEQFKALCANNVQRNVHWLRKEAGKYIWHKSRGNITYLVEHREPNDSEDINDRSGVSHLSEDQLAAHYRPVIISDMAGMGKSAMLTYLAWKMKENEPDTLVLKIDLNHHVTALSQVTEKSSYDLRVVNEAVKFLIDKLLNHENDLTRMVYETIIARRRKVALLFDGFDEISPTYEASVINLIVSLAKYGIEKLIIATRPHTRTALECKLNAFSYEMQPLSAKNQEDFLTRLWKNSLCSSHGYERKTEDRIKKYAEAILKKLARSIRDQRNKFTGIPLQVRLVAEIFGNHIEGKRGSFDSCREFIDSEIERPNFPAKIDLVYLYEHFIERKFDIYFEKTGGNIANEALKEFRKVRFVEFIGKHTKFALDTLLGEDKVHELLPSRQDVSHSLSHQANRADIVEERTGIITQFIDGQPQFGHRTYAEYFVAKFLSDMLKKGNQNPALPKIVVADILLGKNYENMRAFMNCLLSDMENSLEGEFWKLHVTMHRSVLNETIFHVAAAEGNGRIIDLFLNSLRTNPGDRKSLINFKDVSGKTAVHRAVGYACLTGIKSLVEGTEFEINSQDSEGVTPLHLATLIDKLDIVEYLVYKGANVNSESNNGGTPLHVASQKDNLDVMSYLLENGANVNAQTDDGWSPLHLATWEGKLDLLSYLLDKGANVNAPSYNGGTPLHVAAQKGKFDVVSYLLENGANVNAQTNDGRTPLYVVARDGKLNLVSYFVDKGADVNAQTKDGWGPLHVAAQEGKLDVLMYLVDNGANVNAHTNDGGTPLHIAAQEGESELVDYLSKNGADINAQTTDGRTPLCSAAQGSKLDVVSYLVNKGASVNTPTNGVTPLHLAAQKSQLDLVSYLLDNGANVNAQALDGRTPLHMAAREFKLDLVSHLLDKGANINAQANNGGTPLHVAVAVGKLDSVTYLLDNGANVNAQMHNGRTPLHLTALVGELDVVRYLLNNGADVNALTDDGWTPLHIAVREGKLDLVSYLLDNRANVNAQTNSGMTSLDVAACVGKLNLMSYLLEKGANLNAHTNRGWTALQGAAQAGKLDVVKFLLNKAANSEFQINHSWTPQCASAHTGKLPMVEYSLDKAAYTVSQIDCGWTLLHAAAFTGKLQAVMYSLKKGININSITPEGWTPLHAAAIANKFEAVKYLSDMGANVNFQAHDGWTPLHAAASAGNLNAVEYLIDMGADANSRSSDGRQPVYEAAEEGHLDVVQYLVEKTVGL